MSDSFQWSNHEQIVLVAHYNRVTVSELLLSLFKIEQCEWFTRESLFCSQKTRDLLKKIHSFHHVLTVFPFPSFPLPIVLRDSLLSLFQKERNRDSLFRSQKTSDPLKNQRANSQPCFPWINAFRTALSHKISKKFASFLDSCFQDSGESKYV